MEEQLREKYPLPEFEELDTKMFARIRLKQGESDQKLLLERIEKIKGDDLCRVAGQLHPHIKAVLQSYRGRLEAVKRWMRGEK